MPQLAPVAYIRRPSGSDDTKGERQNTREPPCHQRNLHCVRAKSGCFAVAANDLPCGNQISAKALTLWRYLFRHVRSRGLMHISRLALIALATFLAARAAPAGAAVLVTIDKSTQRMMVAVDGSVRWIWPISTGQLGHDTPSGRYTAFRMEADHFSKEWDDAPMPHSIFFSPTGHAIHGSFNTRRIGSPASHGCVRLEPANAARLYALVEQQGLPNTKVVVTGDVRMALARRGMRRYRAADEGFETDAPFGAGPYGYGPRSDSAQATSGYRAVPSPNYRSYGPPYAAGNWGRSYRPFGD